MTTVESKGPAEIAVGLSANARHFAWWYYHGEENNSLRLRGGHLRGAMNECEACGLIVTDGSGLASGETPLGRAVAAHLERTR